MLDDDSGQSVNLPVSVATRISSRDNERLEQYMEQEDVGKSVAARRLLRSALEQELEDDQSDEESVATGDILFFFAGVGVFAILAGEPHVVVYPATLAFLGAALYLRFSR